MTTWINKNKFKEENFSIKEGFADISLNTNPLEIFLKANPLKSVVDRTIVDSRNVKEAFSSDYDNIKPLGKPSDENTNDDTTTDEEKEKTNEKNNKKDTQLINSIIVSLFSLFIALFVSYNWYFNFTEGFSKRIPFHENFDFVNYLYFFTEYFYKIIRFFDFSISVKIPDLVKDFFMKRLIFILIFMNSYFIVKYVILFLKSLYKYANDVIAGKKRVDILKYFYIPKSGSIYMSLLFAFYVIEGIISSFKKNIESMVSSNATNLDATNLNPDAIPDPSNAFKDSLLSFKVAHPIVYLIVVLIRVAIVYGPTISIASFLIFMYFVFYSLFGIFYYLKINKDPIDESNLYHGTRDGSFVDMFRQIHAIMNVNHIFTEIKEEPKGLEWVYNKLESFLRIVFNNLPFIILFYGLFNSIPSILKIYSPTTKWMGISIISVLSIMLFKFMIDENPTYNIIQQDIQNKLNNLVNMVSHAMQAISEDESGDDEATVTANALATAKALATATAATK
jgi:hypothetical protein